MHTIIVKSGKSTDKVIKQLRLSGHNIDSYSVRPVSKGFELSIPHMDIEEMVKAAEDAGQRVLG